MSKADQKKQRRGARREAKRYDARRKASVSPVKRLADAKGEVECWISEDFESLGQLQAFVYKRAAGLSGVACFLVDRGVVGLKDAWVELGIDRDHFDDMLRLSKDQNLSVRRGTLDEVRKWVAGGIRWARENGMCLPKNWQKSVALIGGVGDLASADVAGFVKEFAGHPEDLRQRLVAEPFETYIQRTDVRFEFSEEAPYIDQRTGAYLNTGFDDLEAIAADIPADALNEMAQQFTASAAGLTFETEQWLTAQGETPSSQLLDGWRSVMLASVLSRSAMPDAAEADIADFGYDLLQDISARIDPAVLTEYDRAVDQVLGHLETDPAMMTRAVLKFGMA